MADWAYDVGFDAASRSVTFRRAGVLRRSRWSYDVATGELTRVDSAWKGL